MRSKRYDIGRDATRRDIPYLARLISSSLLWKNASNLVRTKYLYSVLVLVWYTRICVYAYRYYYSVPTSFATAGPISTRVLPESRRPPSANFARTASNGEMGRRDVTSTMPEGRGLSTTYLKCRNYEITKRIEGGGCECERMRANVAIRLWTNRIQSNRIESESLPPWSNVRRVDR